MRLVTGGEQAGVILCDRREASIPGWEHEMKGMA